MKRWLGALVACVPLASAPMAPVESRAYRWNELAAEQHGGRTVRLVLSGSTLDLESLEIRGITLPVGGKPDSGSTHPDTELFLMVKEGDLAVEMGGVRKTLGSGSVAVALPGDRQIVANAGTTPATYYQFTYRAKAPADPERGRAAGGSFMIDARELKERTTGSGKRRDVFDRPTTMFRRFEAHYSSVNEGLRNHATHSHRAEEIMMLRAGEVELLIGDTRPRASAGDVVYLGTQLPHSLQNVGQGATEYLVIQGE